MSANNSCPQQIQFPDHITIAADTEFEGPHTLTIQTACRISDDQMGIQVYHSPLIPELPSDLDLDLYLPPDDYGRFMGRPLLRQPKLITPELSPGRMVRDLVGIPFEVLSRYNGQELIDDFGYAHLKPPNVNRNPRTGRWAIPSITVLSVVHYQPADYFRLFGRNFLDGLRNSFVRDRGDVAIENERKLIKLVECRWDNDYNDPIIEYLRFPDGTFLP